MTETEAVRAASDSPSARPSVSSPWRPGPSKGKPQNTIPDLVGLHELNDQEQLFKSLANRQAVGDFQDPRHRLTGGDPFVGVAGHRPRVVSHHDTPVFRGPRKKHGIQGALAACLSNCDDVDVRQPAPQTCDDLVVEVLVRKELQHARPGSAGGGALPNAAPELLGRVLPLPLPL